MLACQLVITYSCVHTLDRMGMHYHKVLTFLGLVKTTKNAKLTPLENFQSYGIEFVDDNYLMVCVVCVHAQSAGHLCLSPQAKNRPVESPVVVMDTTTEEECTEPEGNPSPCYSIPLLCVQLQLQLSNLIILTVYSKKVANDCISVACVALCNDSLPRSSHPGLTLYAA